MVSENKVDDHQRLADSIPTSPIRRDHVSMGDLSQNRRPGTRQCAEGHRHRAGRRGVGDLAASGKWGEHGIDNRPATRAAYDFLRSKAEPVEKDILMIDYLKITEMVKDHSILEAVEKVAPLK